MADTPICESVETEESIFYYGNQLIFIGLGI